MTSRRVDPEFGDLDNATDTVKKLRARPPRLWILKGDKLGDNAQVRMVADSLGLAYTVKHLIPKQKYVLGKPRFRASLDHLVANSADSLSPPWPDLVITAGRRHAMAALWIKSQSPGTKLVLLGRPRRWIDSIDLVISPPQYHLPDLPQIMRLSLPLMRTDRQSVVSASRAWTEKLSPLNRPIIAVLIGGATQPYRFDAEVTTELLKQCRKLQAIYGATLYFLTSRRTSPDIVNTLKVKLPEGAQLYEWHQNSSDNPYLALLHHAEYFVVTGDSVSMMVEVADQGKPLAIFQLPSSSHAMLWQSFTRRLHTERDNGSTNRLFRWLGRFLYHSGLVGFSRDLTRIHTLMIDGGYAVRLGNAFKQPSRALPDELGQIREKILALLADT